MRYAGTCSLPRPKGRGRRYDLIAGNKIDVKFTRSARVTRFARKFNLRKAIDVVMEMYTQIQKVPQNSLKRVIKPLYNNLISLLI